MSARAYKVGGIALLVTASATGVGEAFIEREGEAYQCWATDRDEQLDATAKLSLIIGDLRGYVGKDINGFPVRIDARNSRDFECLSLKKIKEDHENKLQKCRRLLATPPVKSPPNGQIPPMSDFEFERASCEATIKEAGEG